MPKQCEALPLGASLQFHSPSSTPVKKNGNFSFAGQKTANKEKLDPDAEHPVTDCMGKVSGKVNDPGAYCASINDKVQHTTKWRGKQEKNNAGREADGGSSMIAYLRPQNREKAIRKTLAAHESKGVTVRTRLREADGSTPGLGNKFRVILIKEGIGNLRDCFYYTKECLQRAVPLFEGIKCFADHPNSIEEQVHPERSTRDIIGHFEDVGYVEENEQGLLMGTLILLEGAQFAWAKSLLTNALEYSTKYPDADFVGLSINAQGEAATVPLMEFMANAKFAPGVQAKLDQAIGEGVEEVRPVSLLKDAKSCDLVTEAGAGGKILTMMERDKKPMKVNKTKKPVREAKKPVVTQEADSPAKDDHADEDQDKALFQKMIKQYLGDDSGVDQEEAMELAKHAYEHHQSEGMEKHEAYEAAGSHLKAASAIGKKMSDKKMKPADGDDKGDAPEDSKEESEGEAHEETEAHEESEEGHHEESQSAPDALSPGKKGSAMPKESNALRAELMQTKAQLVKVQESVKAMEVRDYLNKKLAASDKSPEFVKAFRESLGSPKSVAEIEGALAMFTKAYERGVEDASADAKDDDGGFVFTEKSAGMQESDGDDAKVIDFSACAE